MWGGRESVGVGGHLQPDCFVEDENITVFHISERGMHIKPKSKL